MGSNGEQSPQPGNTADDPLKEEETPPILYNYERLDLGNLENYRSVQIKATVWKPFKVMLWGTETGLEAGAYVVLVRRFSAGNEEYYYGFLGDSLGPLLIAGEVFENHLREAVFSNTFYDQLLGLEEVSRLENKDNGVYLTVDFCQSQKPWDGVIFEKLADIARETGKAQPVALCMTYLWMERYREEVATLKAMEAGGLLALTWVNHSLTHPVADNFLVNPGVDFFAEVLKMEQYFLSQEIAFSPFFRFPGLVYDFRRISELRSLGLINLTASAWLAKGEPATNSSIVLIHGNGNEPQGIKLFLDLLKEKEEMIKSGSWNFLPMS